MGREIDRTSPKQDKQLGLSAARKERLQRANTLLVCIGTSGRQFFYSKKFQRFGYLSLDERGRVWFHDEHTGKAVYTHQAWLSRKGFSHGGTLNGFIRLLAQYVHRGTTMNPYNFGPWPSWIAGGDQWGYGEDMIIVRNMALQLGITEAPFARADGQGCTPKYCAGQIDAKD